MEFLKPKAKIHLYIIHDLFFFMIYLHMNISFYPAHYLKMDKQEQIHIKHYFNTIKADCKAHLIFFFYFYIELQLFIFSLKKQFIPYLIFKII